MTPPQIEPSTNFKGTNMPFENYHEKQRKKEIDKNQTKTSCLKYPLLRKPEKPLNQLDNVQVTFQHEVGVKLLHMRPTLHDVT